MKKKIINFFENKFIHHFMYKNTAFKQLENKHTAIGSLSC